MKPITVTSYRTIVLASFVFLLLSVCLTGLSFLSVAAALSCSLAMALSLPLRGEESSSELVWAALALMLGIVWMLCVLAAWIAPRPALNLLVLAEQMLLALKAFLDNRRRYRKLRPLFSQKAVWAGVENDARWVYVVTYCALSAALISLEGWLLLAPELALAVLYVLLVLRALSGYTFIMGRRREKELRRMLCGYLRYREPTESERTSAGMQELFEKIRLHMETSKDYLHEGYTLQDLANAIYTNRSYVSKTINVLTGQNFRQFVNYYRVLHSLNLISANPHLRIEELATMSGFNSAVSFNMAFKLYQGETPGEMIQRARSKSRVS